MSKTTGKAGGSTPRRKPKPKPRAFRRAEAVDKAIVAFEKKLDKEANVTVGEYIRLVQLQKEIDGDEPKDVSATWIEPSETESSEE